MTTRLHAIHTGSVTPKEAVHHGRGVGLRRRTAIFTERRWSPPLPILCWLIEHEEGPILVDAGEVAGARNLPFARYHVAREEEIEHALGRIGLAAGDLRSIVLTHSHGDHIDGLARLPAGNVSIGAAELRLLRSPGARLTRRLLRMPLPVGFDPAPLRFTAARFGAFDSSAPLTTDGSVVAVATPGHTLGHISVIVVIDGRHHFLAGDATYDERQLQTLGVDGLAPSADQARKTMRRILRHAREHPTVYLPSHDPQAPERLADGQVLQPV